MASDAQIRANKENALKSTGPRTPTGKKTVRHNALKHGLLAQAVVLRDEDGAEFEQFASSLFDELQPEGELESLLVDRIAACAWRLRRLLRIETGIFTREVYAELADRAHAMAARYVRTESPLTDMYGDLAPKMTIIDSDEHAAAKDAAAAATAIRDSPDALLGLAFVKDATGPDALSKLSRYETTLERAMYRALAQLREVQAVRARMPAPGELPTP